MIRRATLFVVGITAACSMMPEYRRPGLPVAEYWENSTTGLRQAGPLGWREFFPDSRLQALIDTALENNRDMRIAVLRIEEAHALLGIAQADRYPNAELFASGAAVRTPADLSLTGRAGVGRRYDVGFSQLSFELDFWGRVRSLNEAALANYLASIEAKHAMRLGLIADVANAYLIQLELDERMALARASMNTRAQTRLLVDRRREVGLASDFDYLQADSALQSARAELASLDRQRVSAANALMLLVGADIAKDSPGRTLAEQGIVADLIVNLPSEVLLNRPDVLAVELRLKAANANIGVARAAFLPRISLTAGVGTASSALSGLFESGQVGWNFQPALRLPLFDAGRIEGNVDLAEARRNVAVAEYEKTIQQAFREVADLLAAREQLAEQLRANDETSRIQGDRLRLAEARYTAGVTSYFEVLDASREYYSAQQTAIQTRRLLVSSAAQLYKALGGGKQR